MARPGIRAHIWAAPAILFLLAGCGGLIKPEGYVHHNGQPFIPPKNRRVRVTFHPVKLAEGYPDTDYFDASVKQGEGFFYLVGRRGKGIPPGRYKITVKFTSASGESDKWGGRYNVENTPFEQDVDGSDYVIVDLPNVEE